MVEQTAGPSRTCESTGYSSCAPAATVYELATVQHGDEFGNFVCTVVIHWGRSGTESRSRGLYL
jgi:hypothetical protein